MDVNNMLQELDKLFAENKISEVGPFLEKAWKQAAEAGDFGACITIVNEQIGFYRSTCEYDKSLAACGQAFELIEKMNLKGTIPYATTMLNVANAYRACGKCQEALTYFKEVEAVYEKQLGKKDFNIASLNNNIALLYQELGDYDAAVGCLKKALDVALSYGDAAASEIAVTYTNLGVSFSRLGKHKEAKEALHAALSYFGKINETGYHYSAALAGLGEVCFAEGEYDEAVGYYESAASELEKVFGKNQNYELMQKNIEMVKKACESKK